MENKIIKIVVISPGSKYIIGTTNTPFYRWGDWSPLRKGHELLISQLEPGKIREGESYL